MDEVGGTKISRPSPGGSPNGPPPQMAQQQMDPQMQQQMMQQQQQQQMMQQQMMQQQQIPLQLAPKGILKKSSFSNKFSFDSPNFKSAVVVMVIFLLLNSKMVWKQIMLLPFMGGLDPSIVALVFNSVLAGLAFYLVSNFLN
jgi:hypothetical protein